MSDETVVDGEIVAMDEAGKPSFNLLQNYGSSRAPPLFYAFDLPILSAKDLKSETLKRRRELLHSKVLTKLSEPIRFSPVLDASLSDLVQSVRE